MSDGRLNFKATIDDKDFNRKLDGMKKGVDALSKSVTSANRSLGKGNTFNITDKSITNINNSTNTLNRTLNNTKTNLTQVNQNFNQTNNTLNQLNNTTGNLNNSLNQTSNASDRASRGLKGVFTRIASYFGVFVGIQSVISLIRGAFNTIVDFDSRLLNVSKTTGLAGKELKDLGTSLRNLSQELKVISVDKLMEFAGVAGQLGIKGTQEILAFTEALAKLSVTSNIQGEEGAIQIARFLGLVEGDVKNVKDLGDELTNLGNNFKVFEDEIIKNALAIAQNTGTFKLGRQEILAYATSLKEAGVEAELTGASLGRTYQQIEKVLRTGKNIDNLAKITGQSVEDLKEAFKTDPQGVVYSFIKGLNEVQEAGGSVNNAITSIGITATRDLRVIGTLATGGFAVLNRAMNDVKDSSGAMQEEFETASGKISNSIESVKVSWENLILAVNSSENEIGTTISFWAKALSGLIDWIARATTSWKELNRIASGKGTESGFESVMSRRDRISVGEATQQAFLLEQELRKLNDQRRQLESDISETGSKSQRDLFKKRLEDLSGVIGYVNSQMIAYRNIASGIEKIEPVTTTTTDFDDDKETKKSENALKKRLAFLDELQKAENNLTQSTLSGLDLELAKVEEVYQSRLKKAKELSANQKALNDIESLRVREIETVTYKTDTEALKISLEQQKKDYEDFENFKKQVGVEKATEMYSGIIDVSKSYYDVLRDELNNIDLSTATAKEKERYNAFFKMFQEYGQAKTDEDRKALESLVLNTQSVTDKLKILYENYQRDLAILSERYTGERLKQEQDKLYESFASESESLRSSVLGYTDEFQKALDIIGASTRRQAQTQIDSLTKLLTGANKLTKSQVVAIKNTIKELNKALLNTDEKGKGGILGQLSTQINLVEKEIKDYQDAIKEAKQEDGESVEQFTARVKLMQDALELLIQKSESLKFEKLVETFVSLGDMSSAFNSLGDSLAVFDDGLGNTLKAVGDILKIVGLVGKLLEAVGAGVRAAGESGGNMWVAIIGAVVQIAGAISQMISEGKKRRDQARKEFAEFYRNLLTSEYEYQALLRERELARIENDDDQTPLERLKAQQDAIKKQMIDIKREYDEILEKILTSGRYISDVERDKQKNKNIFAELSGLSGDIEEQYAQLEKMFLEGRLEGDTLAWFEALKKSKEELEALGYTMEDVIRMQEELITGTTWSEMASQIADMFASGTNSAIEFANTMEDVIRNAIVAGFKARFIDEQMQNLFDMLAAFSEDGLTEDEISQFKMNYEKVFEDLNKQWEQITEGLGFDFGTDDLGGSAKDGIKRITESQADRLTGILTGMQVDVIESRKSLQISNNLLSSSLDNLIAIEFNTRATADNTYQMVQILQNNQQKALGL